MNDEENKFSLHDDEYERAESELDDQVINNENESNDLEGKIHDLENEIDDMIWDGEDPKKVEGRKKKI